MTPRELFEVNLELIEKVLRTVCRRNAFPTDESEEFGAWAKLRLIDDDYAVLRKFQGRSSLPTYLTVVIANLFRDYRIHRWGKWRPSAEAKRLGTVAVQLESLVSRDGRSVGEAIATLRTSFGVERPARELEAMAARLPQRTKRRLEGDEALEWARAAEGGDDRLVERELRATEREAEAALAGALAALDAAERLLLKLRFADGLAVVDIARMLGEPARPLYSRIERALAALRHALESGGLDATRVAGLVGWAGLDLTVDFGTGAESADRGPSKSMERTL
jgi:RNA polymerase sigma factor for flagellar operon FliA